MTEYGSIILLTELLMLAMTIHVLGYSGFTKEQKKWFLFVFISIMLCAGAEFLAKHFDGASGTLRLPLTVITVIQFSLATMMPVFLLGALGSRRLAKYGIYFFALHTAAEIISAPFGWIFYFDETGKYFHGKFYIIYEVFYILSVLVLIAGLFLVGRKFKKRDTITIIMILLIMAVTLVLLIVFKVYADYLGVAVCACLCYIYYNDLTQQDIQSDLVNRQEQISQMQTHTISGFANLIESRDMETGEHVARTSAYAKTLAEAARKDGVYADELDDNFIELMYELAPMHDVGKIVVSDQILKKPGKLTSEEFELMKTHAAAGGKVIHEVLNGIADEEYIRFAEDIATYHHERWDGSGYPTGMSGEQIPLSARIMAVVDVYDALIAERCYKKPIPVDKAIEIIREESGTHFDPKLVEVFLNHRDEFI